MIRESFLELNFMEYLPELAGLPIENVVGALLAEKIEPAKIDLTIRYILESGYRFSPAECSALGKKLPVEYLKGMTYAHAFAWRGYRFELAEILDLGNPANALGETIAHFMANAGYAFSPFELDRIGNPRDRSGRSVATCVATHQWNNKVRASADFVRPKRIIYRNSEPIFDIENHDGRKQGQKIFVIFEERWLGDFIPIYTFTVAFENGPAGWQVFLDDSRACQRKVFNYLYHKAVLVELVRHLNGALRDQQPCDFTEYIKLLNGTFDDCFQVDAYIG